MTKKIYLDNAATTKVDEEVIKAMLPFFSEKFGNPNSLHEFGREAKESLELSRNKIAGWLNVKAEEIIFTGSGTESNNLIIKGLAEAYPEKKQIITSVIEHPAILENCKYMEKKGYKLDYISVDSNGRINLEELKSKINANTLLVSVMHVNNEIGSIQPIEEIAEICKGKCFFHTDAVQSFGKISINASGIDALSASSHKINGPKGAGLLYLRKGIKISPLLHGGGQENKIRSGTENIAGIAGFAKAVELAEKKIKNTEKIKKLRDMIIEKLLKIPGSRLNGSIENRIFNNINVTFENVEGESLIMLLDKEGIACSTGSACSSHSLKASHVLKAIGLRDEEAHGSLRITLGWDTTEKDIEYAAKKIKEAVEKLRNIYGKN